MSRIGKMPIAVPKEAQVKLADNMVHVEGPKGKLEHSVPPGIQVSMSEGSLCVERTSDELTVRSLHGLTRTIIANMIEGVTRGFVKELEVVGVGYRTEKSGTTLKMTLGYSHPIVFEEPEGIQIKVDKQTIRVEGIDRCLVGQVAATIRRFKKPDVYKGKGVRYVGEVVRKKVGKTGAK